MYQRLLFDIGNICKPLVLTVMNCMHNEDIFRGTAKSSNSDDRYDLSFTSNDRLHLHILLNR